MTEGRRELCLVQERMRQEVESGGSASEVDLEGINKRGTQSTHVSMAMFTNVYTFIKVTPSLKLTK